MTPADFPDDRPSDVIVVGRANIDLTVSIPSRPGPGRTVFTTDLATTPGGKGLNQAVAVARLGGRSVFVGNAGDDQWGQLLKTAMAEAGVDVTAFRLVPDARTGAAIIEVTSDGESYIVLALSPATELTGNDIRAALTSRHAPVLVTQLDLPPEPVAALLAMPRPQILVGNLVPHPGLGSSVLAELDVFVANEHEAAAILGRHHDRPQDTANQLRQLGAAAAVITAGERGAAFSWSGGDGLVPAPQVQVVDTTGAGDAFLGALALQFAHNAALPDAVAAAVRAGTAAVEHQGAQLPPTTGTGR